MNTNSHNDPLAGFGERLKEERKRLGLSQAQMGEIGGVTRLSQLQYEAGTTYPNVRYINAIGLAGADTTYLQLGKRFDGAHKKSISKAQEEKIDQRAFEWIEAYARTKMDGNLDAEVRRTLYHLIKHVLLQIEHGALPVDIDLDGFIPSGVGRSK